MPSGACGAAPVALSSVRNTAPRRGDRLADRLLDEAMSHCGAPYSYGASGPRKFDCSGFTGYVFDKFGYSLPRSAAAQSQKGMAVGDIGDLRKGDLIFFAGAGGGSGIGHVGICMESPGKDGSCRFIHAARGGVQVSELKEPYYSSRYRSARRILSVSEMSGDSEPRLARDEGIRPEKADKVSAGAAAGREAKYYTIRSGDTLKKIAARSGCTREDLFELNPDLNRRGVIRLGQVIRIK